MMRPPLALALLLMTASAPEPRVRHVPRVVDPHFDTRYHLCPDAPSRGGVGEANDARRTVAELLGAGLVELQVHQMGDGFADFDAAATHLRWVLAQRPHSRSRYAPWAEATPLAASGNLGTLRYNGGRSGRFEVVGSHACVQDDAGTFWWLRVAPVDVWP